MLALLILAQTASIASLPIATITPGDPATFDLATYRAPDPQCGDIRAVGDDVLVCARMPGNPRSLEEQAAIFEPKPFMPNWKMLGGGGGVHVEQRSTIMGSAPAVMATFKLKF